MLSSKGVKRGTRDPSGGMPKVLFIKFPWAVASPTLDKWDGVFTTASGSMPIVLIRLSAKAETKQQGNSGELLVGQVGTYLVNYKVSKLIGFCRRAAQLNPISGIRGIKHVKKCCTCNTCGVLHPFKLCQVLRSTIWSMCQSSIDGAWKFLLVNWW